MQLLALTAKRKLGLGGGKSLANAPFEVSACPGTGATATNNSDTVQLTNGTCRSLYVAVAGDIKVTMANGDVVTFTSVAAGIFPVSVKQVFVTGTTATGLIAIY